MDTKINNITYKIKPRFTTGLIMLYDLVAIQYGIEKIVFTGNYYECKTAALFH